MCWDGHCLYCIKVETGTMIFAIINVIIAALITLAALIVLLVFNVALETAAKEDVIAVLTKIFGMEFVHTVASAVGNTILGVLALVALVHFIFSILLADGICKKLPSKIKSYFVYGVIGNVCWYITIIGIWAGTGSFSAILHLLVGQIIYTFILVMIRMTYLKIQGGAVYVYAHQQENHYRTLVPMTTQA